MFWQRDDLRVFEYDAGFDRHPPVAVVVPGTAEEIAACVKAASRDDIEQQISHKLWPTGENPVVLPCCCAPPSSHDDTVLIGG